MINFFDVNFWIKNSSIDICENSGIEKLNKILIDNNISSAVISNSLSLGYNWKTGNEELVNSKELIRNSSVFFSFLLVPEVYTLSNFRKYVSKCYSKKVRLFRFFPKSHLFCLSNYYMQGILKVLNEYKFPIMIDFKQFDITGNKYFDVNALENILEKYKRLPFLLECSLKQLLFNRFFFPLLNKYKNLYIETSSLLLMNQVEEIVDKFGPERIIFGTNYPILDVEFSTGRILLSDLDDSSKKDITFNNITRILGNIEFNKDD